MRALLLVLTISLSAFAQVFDATSPPDTRSLRQDGQLFSIQLVLGEPMRFFVVGKEEAKLDLSEVKMTVRRLKPYPGKVITLDYENGYFVSTKPDAIKGATAIEVTTQAKTKTDKVQFKLEQ